jgi:uncharacterized DUF497 family protein
MSKESFEWDPGKDQRNRDKHGVAFHEAQYAFTDPRRALPRTGLTVTASHAITAWARSRTAS